MVFLNDLQPLHDVTDYEGKLHGILGELMKNVSESDLQAEIAHRTRYSLKIKLSTGGGNYLDVDILPAPAANNVSERGRPIF